MTDQTRRGGWGTTDAFTDAFARVVGIEGGYTNNPNDSGGPTRYGITLRTAIAHNYAGKMSELPLPTAMAIYREDYWDKLCLGRIAATFPRLAEELFDSAVNCGVTHAGSWLQRALNGLNVRGTLYHDIPVDGDVGKVTLAALQAFYQHRGGKGEIALRRLCDAQQGCYYMELVERREKDEVFLFGWAINRLGE